MKIFGARASCPLNGTKCGQDARAPKGWHSRGYLPHFDSPEVVQMLTFRLADSLPQGKIEQWRQSGRCRTDRQLANAIENYLDRGYGSCALRNPRAASIVEDALIYFDDTRYKLLSWCVMPNHVHAMLEVVTDFGLSEVLHSWKSFTAKQINALMNISGQFWQEDYFDRYIRNEAHFNRALQYIEHNPVKAGLCNNGGDWPSSSARLRSVGILPA
jgi:REP element-mobilizing transposase RayT